MKYYKIIMAISSLLSIGLMMKNERVMAQRPLHPEIRCFQGYQDRDDDRQRMLDESATANADIDVYAPQDPNEIRGTVGYDDPNSGDTMQWVSASQSLPYTIYFENDPEMATAAAQRVEIRHRFHALGNLATFGIGSFGFGEHIFEVEGSPSSYQQRLDLTESMGLYVDVIAGVDVVTNEAFWIFQSIDPATGLPPQSAEQGFLPINDENHSGEGFVTFTIQPKTTACSTRDVITASASIVFDVNEAINTNVWENTIDAVSPTTQVTGEEQTPDELLLHFIGQDDEDGCGIKQFKLYVSDNYAAYQLYGSYPVGSDVTFATEYNHCYRFISLGEDNVGNVEEMKAEPDFEYGNYNLIVSVVVSPEEGGTVTGAGTYVYDAQVTLTAIPNAEYAFRRWIRDGVTVSEDYVYTFAAHESLELVAEFELASSISMEYELVQGWNWWSTCINMGGGGLEQLENALGENGINIKSQHDGFVVNYGDDWYGNLGSLENRYMYMVQTSSDIDFSLSGVPVNASQLNIDLSSNWTWIGYPLASTQSVVSSLSQLEPDDGDLLKSISQFAVYDGDDGWFGSLNNMNPGWGYMYRALRSHSFKYSESLGCVAKEVVGATNWKANFYTFADNMSIVASVFLDDKELRSDNYEVAAFSNGTCLGSTRLLYNARRDRYYALLPVLGEEGMGVTFKLYSADEGVEYSSQADETCLFSVNAILGSLDNPMALHFGSTSDLQENMALLSLFPNPVKRGGEVRLDLPEDEEMVSVEIYNVLDVLVSKLEVNGTSFRINETLAPGTYVIRVYGASNKVYYRKLIIQ